jgi:isopentenyl phosphate kinase
MLARVMGRVIIKWGGGLITDKSTICTPRHEQMQKLAKTVRILIELGHSVVVVHGAGSFGHLRAREARINEGRIQDLNQDEAIMQIRSDMDQLNLYVADSLINQGLIVKNHPPRTFVINNGPRFIADLERFHAPNCVHITFGDVVRCDDDREFAILSGDDLMHRLSTELPDVTHAIFALGDVPGLMSAPPDVANAELIPVWNSTNLIEGTHASDIDVTGGIFLKANRASAIASTVNQVWFVDGRIPSRILEIVSDGTTIGTRITSE